MSVTHSFGARVLIRPGMGALFDRWWEIVAPGARNRNGLSKVEYAAAFGFILAGGYVACKTFNEVARTFIVANATAPTIEGILMRPDSVQTIAVYMSINALDAVGPQLEHWGKVSQIELARRVCASPASPVREALGATPSEFGFEALMSTSAKLTAERLTPEAIAEDCQGLQASMIMERAARVKKQLERDLQVELDTIERQATQSVETHALFGTW